MSLEAGRVGVRADQVDVHGRVISHSFLNDLIESLPEWTDMPVWVNGTEEILPSNSSVPVTSPILADIQYPDVRRNDQYFTYRESPTTVDGLAKLKRIKGNTLVFNQLIENGNFASTSKWFTQQGATQSISNNVITLTCSTNNGQTVNVFNSIPAGHKCLVSGECKTASANARAFLVYCGSYSVSSAQITLMSSSTNWERLTGIVTSAGNEVFQFRLYADSTTNQFRNAMLIDLTQMFGAGKEPTVEQFNSLFPLPYYSYQSILLPFKGTSIKTTGTNLIDYATIEQGSLDYEQGTTYPIDTRVRTSFIYLEQGSYTITSYMNGYDVVIYMYNSDETYDRNNSITNWQTTPKTFTMAYDGYVKVVFRKTDNSIIRPSEITSERMYNNNTVSTTNLPTSTYFPNGMKSAGNVYDELLPTKAITRVGMVDLGTLTWAITSNGFYADVSDSIADCKNAICSKYEFNPSANDTTGSAMYDKLSDKQFAWYQNQVRVFIKDTSYSDVATFKSSISGVYLYYELATPIELPTLSLGD